MIELTNVTRHYGPKVAVDRLDLHIPAGELFAFLGPNGAGKTTTVKMLVGLLRPTRGEVRLCGVNVAEDPRGASQRVGYVPDQPFLYDKLSGREFLRFVADLRRLSADEARASIAEQIERFELGGFVDHLCETYSHGMKQRLVFGAALVARPRVLILDEPMVGLDPRSMRLVKDLLRAQADGGTTVFMSTHTLPAAEEIADRIGVFNHGKLMFLGTVPELREKLSLRERNLEDLFLTLTREETGGA